MYHSQIAVHELWLAAARASIFKKLTGFFQNTMEAGMAILQGKFSRRSLLKTTAAGVAASPLAGLSLASGRNDEGASHTRLMTRSVVFREEAKMALSDDLAYAD